MKSRSTVFPGMGNVLYTAKPATELLPTERADGVARCHPLVGASSAPLWVAEARNCPPLARCLLAVGAATSPANPFCMTFVQEPDWDALVGELARAESRPSDRSRLAAAWKLRTLATLTSWGTPEVVFWDELTASDSPATAAWTDVFDERPLVRLRAVAQIVEEAGDPGRLAILEQLWPTLDWRALRRELEPSEPSKLTEFTPAQKQTWMLCGQINAVERRCHRQNLELAVARAVDLDALAQAGLALLQSLRPGPWAIWLGPGAAGMGRQGGWAEPANHGAIANRADFERCLDTRLRGSNDLWSESGRPEVGRVYGVDESALEAVEPALRHLAEAADRKFGPALGKGMGSQSPSTHALLAQVEASYRQQFRSALVEFAAGAGHEINNPLGAIVGKARWLLAKESEPERRLALDRILAQVDRIGVMIRDLHLLGREKPTEHRQVDLAEILGDAVSDLAPMGRRLVLWPIPQKTFVKANPVELSRCVREVVKNAMAAAGVDGTVNVRAWTADGPSTTSVIIEVQDSGPGFSAVTKRHAFTPFYSGRSAGRGLGMGLPVAEKIAEEHNGRIELASDPTRVRIILPAA